MVICLCLERNKNPSRVMGWFLVSVEIGKWVLRDDYDVILINFVSFYLYPLVILLCTGGKPDDQERTTLRGIF